MTLPRLPPPATLRPHGMEGNLMRRRLLVFGALTCLAVLLVAAPAAAKGGGGGSHDRRISLSGALVVAADEVVTGPVVSVDGPTAITGRVNNDLVVGRGDLIVSGQR